MTESVEEIKDKIRELNSSDNYSEAVSAFWAWKEKNPKIIDAKSADLHLLAARTFMQYCKQKDNWDEMNKLFCCKKEAEKMPENHAAAVEAKNSVSDAEKSNQKHESEEEKFIKSLHLIDCGKNEFGEDSFISEREFYEKEIKKMMADWGEKTSSSLDGGTLAIFFINELNRKFRTYGNKKSIYFAVPTESATRQLYKKIGTPRNVEVYKYKEAFTGQVALNKGERLRLMVCKSKR